jgi:hypothetical protein
MKDSYIPEESTVVFLTPHSWARFAGAESKPCTMAGKNRERTVTLALCFTKYKAAEVRRADALGRGEPFFF